MMEGYVSKYYRVSVGRQGQYLEDALAGGWIGTGWLNDHDLTGAFPEEWRKFNHKWRDVILQESGTSPVAAGLAAANTWVVGKGIKIGDLVLVPTGQGSYRVARVTGDYIYVPGHPLAQRRPVEWLEREISRDELSEELKRPLRSAGTVVTLGSLPELDQLLEGEPAQLVQVNDSAVENPLSFVLEQHLEDFLVSNWQHTDLGARYDIVTDENGDSIGQQFSTDIGRIDILARSKDGKELLVIELKRGRVSDVVVGQVLRYMGYVNELDEDSTVRGLIIGTDDDDRFRRAISMVPTLDFYKYEVTFTLKKA
jgi:restriction system protein